MELEEAVKNVKDRNLNLSTGYGLAVSVLLSTCETLLKVQGGMPEEIKQSYADMDDYAAYEEAAYDKGWNQCRRFCLANITRAVPKKLKRDDPKIADTWRHDYVAGFNDCRNLFLKAVGGNSG